MKYSAQLLPVLLASVTVTSEAFTIIPRTAAGTTGRRNVVQSSNVVVARSSSALNGRKKGDLGKRVSVGGVTTSSKGKKNKNKKAKKKQVDPTAVSSSLSAWAATLKDDNEATTERAPTSSVTVTSSNSNDASAAFQPFKELTTTNNKKSAKKGSRRERSKQKEASDGLKQAKIDSALENIIELVQNNNLSIQDLLAQITALTQLSAPNTLKSILNQTPLKDYTLAWVGSDEAICHLGTGLHNVPLARLQDIFLTIGRDGSGESNTVRLMEVISILGPFPNVRNTLEGKIIDLKSTEDATPGDGMPLRNDRVQICYETMFDGLGKEITAGTKDNLRFADLDIVFADDRVLVCVVPTKSISSSSNSNSNSKNIGVAEDGARFGEKGQNVLLFLKEEDLELKLEELRVA